MSTIHTLTHRGQTYRLQRDHSGVGHCWRDCLSEDVEGGSTSVAEAAYCALVEDGRTAFASDAGVRYRWVRAAHRPRRDPTAARVNLVCRVHPDTRRRLADEARRTGESQGQIVDRLTTGLGVVRVPDGSVQ